MNLETETVQVILTDTNRLGDSFLKALQKKGYSYIDLKGIDLSNTIFLDETYTSEIVLHSAEVNAIEEKERLNKQDFFDKNLQYTQQLCAVIMKMPIKPKHFIFLSSLEVYGAKEGELLTENFPLLGNNPYALSKIACEEYLIDWSYKNKITLTILRIPTWLSNQNPSGPLIRMHNAIRKGKYNPLGLGNTKVSVLNTEDLVQLFDQLPNIEGIFNLTDGVNPTIVEIEEKLALVSQKPVRKRSFRFLSGIMSFANLLSGGLLLKKEHEYFEKPLRSVTFSDAKARSTFHWTPTSMLENLG